MARTSDVTGAPTRAHGGVNWPPAAYSPRTNFLYSHAFYAPNAWGVPDQQVRWVRSFSLLQERHLRELWQELTRAAAKPANPLEKKCGDFFAACMDVDELQKKGLEPVKSVLQRIAAPNDFKRIATLIGELAAARDPVSGAVVIRGIVQAIFPVSDLGG
jgi:hypothetical protein